MWWNLMTYVIDLSDEGDDGYPLRLRLLCVGPDFSNPTQYPAIPPKNKHEPSLRDDSCEGLPQR